MKKIYLLLVASAITFCTQAQTIVNSGMESWRVRTSGGSTPKPIWSPTGWYGGDSLLIANGEIFGTILSIDDSVWKQQVFKDSANFHGGSFAAKLVTKLQDTLGVFPGTLSNAEPHVSIDLGTGSFTFYYSGGTPINYRVNTVSAWVKYAAGAGADSGVLNVQVLGRIGSKPDSVLGAGTIKIGPNSAFTQVTANVLYSVPDSLVDTVRITFASSKGGTASAVNSILYVDDVTMTGTPFSVAELAARANVVKVYPNPANNLLHVSVINNETVTCNLVSVTGQVVATKVCTGNATMDIATIAAGQYFYNVIDASGKTVQSGGVTIAK